MSTKKNRLIERAKETLRQPKTASAVSNEPKKNGYKVIAISLYSPEAEWIEQITKMLQLAGNPKANRSLVVREAILRMQQEMEGKNAQEILKSFIDSHSKRAQIF